jgi:MFS transporter, FSR family, fosmidomycin resistance protein
MASEIANSRKGFYRQAMSVTTVPLGRDLKVMGLVGSAHAASHFFHLTLPPIFLLLKAEFNVSYTSLGLLTTLFYASSGVCQTIAGFLVDRFGARRILLMGLTLLSVSVIGYGFATEFWMLAALSVCAGLGNSVFHPADLSILTSKVSAIRLGRAYGVHALSGNLGWAAAPTFMITVTYYSDWRSATIAAGMIGLAIVASFIIWGTDLSEAKSDTPAVVVEKDNKRDESILRNLRLLFTPTILSCFFYFAFLAAALIGVQSFGVTAMESLYEVDIREATGALTAFLIGSAGGILCGGFAADRTDRHDLIAMAGVLLAAAVLVAIGAQVISASILVLALALAGFLSGTTAPSRDMLVRKATPKGATGRIFGFVYSGLDLGSSLMPLAMGIVMDGGGADLVFYACAAMLVVTMATVTQVRPRNADAVTTA